MNLTVQETYEYDFGCDAWLIAFLPFAEGRGVAAFRNAEDGFWLLEVGTPRGVVMRTIAPEIVNELKHYVRGDDDQRPGFPSTFLVFKFGERVGLLARDKKIYLFDDIAAEPVVIDIAMELPQVALPYGANYRMSYYAASCGNSATTAIPVIFVHPNDRSDYPGYMALLEIDIDGRTASWHTHDGNLPQPVIFGEHRHVSDERGLEGSIIHDAAWTGDKLLIFSIGARPQYFRARMSYSILLDTDVNAKSPHEIYECDESVFGKICASLDKVILTPLYKTGPRKGKQSLFDMKKKAEEAINIPRRHTKCTVLDIGDYYAWMTPDAIPPAIYKPGPMRFMRCTVQAD